MRLILFTDIGVQSQFYMINMSYIDKYMFDVMVIGIEMVKL